MANKHATYIVKDIQRGAEPKKDKEITLAVTTDPAKALNAVRNAVVFGVIEMTYKDKWGDETLRTFTPQSYTRDFQNSEGFRRDRKGNGQYHGFLEHCTSEGFGDPCPPKVRKKTVKKRATVKQTR